LRTGGRVCGSSDLQGRSGFLHSPPRTEGPWAWRTTPPPQVAALARCERLRDVRSVLRGPSTGGDTRSIPRRLASPLPSTTFDAPLARVEPGWNTVILEVPSTGLRGMRKHARSSLLTLTPTFPSRPDSIRSDLQAGLSLLGLSKDRPSIVPNRRVRRPGARVLRKQEHGSLRGETASLSRVPPAWFRTTSTDFPLRPCRSVSPCCRSWGSPSFHPSRNGLPIGAVPALRSLSPADSDGSGTSPSPWAHVTVATIADRSLHRAPCPPTLVPGTVASGFPPARPPRSRATFSWRRGLEALLHRRVRRLRVRFRLRRPVTPLGLAGPAAAAHSTLATPRGAGRAP